MSGLSLEALNDIGQRRHAAADRPQRQRDVDQPDGRRVRKYLSQIKLSSRVAAEQERLRPADRADPVRRPDGPRAVAQRLRKSVVNFAQPGQLFEDLGITYIGVVPGHDLRALLADLRGVRSQLEEPVIVHVRTQKGRGYRPAEADQVGFHGAALPPMTAAFEPQRTAATRPSTPGARIADAQPTHVPAAADMPTKSMADDAAPATRPARCAEEAAQLHGRLRRRAGRDRPRRPAGRGDHRRHADRDRASTSFQASSPTRFFDVGIAEQHAVTMATGLALGGSGRSSPSTRRSCSGPSTSSSMTSARTTQPVVIGVDRAGLVGEDGTSHQGMFTLPAQRQLPNLVIASPKDEQELRRAAADRVRPGPPVRAALPARPRLRPAGRRADADPGRPGRGAPGGPRPPARRLRADRRRAASQAADRLAAEGWSVGIINARFAKPLDRAADPRAGARQAAGRDARGERRDRRLRQRRRSSCSRRPRSSIRPSASRDQDHRHPRRPVRRPRLGRRPAPD